MCGRFSVNKAISPTVSELFNTPFNTKTNARIYHEEDKYSWFNLRLKTLNYYFIMWIMKWLMLNAVIKFIVKYVGIVDVTIWKN